MVKIDRRTALHGGSAAIIAAAFGARNSALAHVDAPVPPGAWASLAPMPFPAQEIYPAPFWRDKDVASAKTRRAFNIIVSAGGLIGNEDAGDPFTVTDQVAYYDLTYDAWGTGTPLPDPRHHLSLVNNRGFLYGIGGFADTPRGHWDMRQECWRLREINGAWSPIRSLPHPQAESACISMSGFIHVIGGRAPAGTRNGAWRDHIETNKHWFYDAHTDFWESLAPMPTARHSAAGVRVGNYLYVMGGRVGRRNVATVEAYDRTSDRWSALKPMPKPSGSVAAGVINNKVYIFGGENYTVETGGEVFTDAWEYDPRADDWRPVAPMPRPRHGHGAVAIDDKIYVLGGSAKVGAGETTNTLDKFEIDEATTET